MASPGDTIFWPTIDGKPQKKWPKGQTQPVETFDTTMERLHVELQQAMAREPERYQSLVPLSRWQRIKRTFGLR